MLPSRTSVEQLVLLSLCPTSMHHILCTLDAPTQLSTPPTTFWYLYTHTNCAHSCLNVLLHLVLYVGINVPRSCFLPVKKTSDLLVVMSNLFQPRDGTLVQNQARLYPELPLVKLVFMKVYKHSQYSSSPDPKPHSQPLPPSHTYSHSP